MSRRKKYHGKLNSRKQREKTLLLKTLREEAQARPLHTCRRETTYERFEREKAEKAQRRAEELWAGKLYDWPIGPTELAPRWQRMEQEEARQTSQPMMRRRPPLSHLLMIGLLVAGIPEPRR